MEEDLGGASIRVFTTRPDTIFGVDFMVLAPEHELVKEITTPGQKEEVEKYLAYVNSRSDRERMAEVKQITGCFTGPYAIHPFDGRQIPVWIAEYVLAGYGTGAIMGVPCGDQRDFNFAKHFNIPVTNIIGEHFNKEEANPTKDAILQNSDFINGLLMKDAIDVVINKSEELGIGKRKINYKMHDAGFSRQRYWGEPFPVIYKNGVPYPLDEKELPLELPYIESYSSGPEGEGPLANIKEWVLIPNPSPSRLLSGEKGAVGAALVPKYSVSTPTQYELAKQMRKKHTEAENILWQAIRGNQLGAKFRRQHAIEVYIADFVSLQKKLIIEVDGGYHETEEQKKYDALRTKTLNEIGFKVIRFSNEQIKHKLNDVLKHIKKELSEDTAPLSTSWRGAGGEGPALRETNTMPGYAGSSWYFLRYMDPHNDKEFCSRKVSDYWGQVDLYIGGTEHAVGHLLYSRMWTKVLFDLGYIGFDEPYKKLVNQGMLQGRSSIIYRLNSDGKFYSKNIFHKTIEKKVVEKSTLNIPPWEKREFFQPIRVDINLVKNDILDVKALKTSYSKFANEDFVFEDDGTFRCDFEVEKMSKSKYNVVNPNDIINEYGADTFRMYEMFLGPIDQSKPWDTKGIEGVHRFLKKFWRLYADETKGLVVTDEAATDAEMKVLHKTIKKIEED
ncbi:MAG: DUF559 domain-containing protein, partial [Bacteroidota bacterium]|nr:DUF559 domain-containing protein [Bacteroidota bacterium]